MQKKNTVDDAQKKSILTLILLIFVIILVEVFAIVMLFKAPSSGLSAEDIRQMEEQLVTESEPPPEPTTEPVTEPPVIFPEMAADVQHPGDNLFCENALLLDVDNHEILAIKGEADAHIFPASMTKMMTLIVAVEHIENMSDTYTITEETLTPGWEQGASMAGFQVGEVVTMKDLLYGVALPSGADATVAIAEYTAGSEEKFVEWMNEKCEELGLQNTHFVNTSGLHNENHYSSLKDIALILEYLLKNETCKEIISTYIYTTRATDEHPNGITFSNTMFDKMYGTEVEGITILGGKTGFTDESGQCLACYAETPDGHLYIAVTSRGSGKKSTVFDSFKLFGIVTGTYAMDTEVSPW